MSMDFFPLRSGLFSCSERERDRERKKKREGGENAVGAGETESSHQAWLVTMGMLYIVIHFLSTFPSFLFWGDLAREEKC